jgi:endonuclease-8
MPEGDVVRRTALRLDAALAGQLLTASDLRWPSLATADLAGRTVLGVQSVGKHLLLRCDGDPALTLHSHLRMEGSWHVLRTGEPFRSRPASGIRAVLETPSWTAVGHRLGMLDLVRTDEEGTLVGHLGPDLLDPDLDRDDAACRLLAEPGRTVGEALLDQRVVAGVGTMFMAEVLFVLGATPWTTVADVEAGPGTRRLVDLAVRMLQANVERAVQTTTGDTRNGQQTYVHARSGRPCRRCGTTVRVAPIGPAPQDRTAFYCPSCQRGPTPTDDGRAQAPLGSSSGSPSRRRTQYQRYRR